MILMGPEPILAAFRQDLEAAVEGEASVTKAMDRMLEVLPPGASKGTGMVGCVFVWLAVFCVLI